MGLTGEEATRVRYLLRVSCLMNVKGADAVRLYGLGRERACEQEDPAPMVAPGASYTNLSVYG